jgi:hypothetical protein
MDSKYKLMVVATDGGMSTMTKVSVTILDDNDNNPVCNGETVLIREKKLM